MFDWPNHLLAAPNPALGWKQLQRPSRNALRFLSDHADLRVASEAIRQGEAGILVPNFADSAAATSLHTSFFFLNELLALTPRTQVQVVNPDALAVIGSGQEFGSKLETKIATGLRAELRSRAPGREIYVASRGSQDVVPSSFRLTDYWPYQMAPTAPDQPLAQEFYRQMGRGHLIQPDVVVWRRLAKSFDAVSDEHVLRQERHEVLHLIACISGKATIRSDRSQSSRYEGATITRWRHARAPHFVVVTAEPDPARLGSLAWGLGEIDCVYHVSVKALHTALVNVHQHYGRQESKLLELEQLIAQARVRDVSQLFDDLFGEFLD